jgi:uncharacterized protein YecE (DUF72 family)
MFGLAVLEMAGFFLVPQKDWFGHYLKHFDTVEINASFYSWPTVAGVQAWRRQPGKKKFIYTVKVSEHITHIKRFKGTKTLIRDFGMIADILGGRMGCFLFQLPPSYRYTKTRLNDIVSQIDPARRNVVERRFGRDAEYRPNYWRRSSVEGRLCARPRPAQGREEFYGRECNGAEELCRVCGSRRTRFTG